MHFKNNPVVVFLVSNMKWHFSSKISAWPLKLRLSLVIEKSWSTAKVTFHLYVNLGVRTQKTADVSLTQEKNVIISSGLFFSTTATS